MAALDSLDLDVKEGEVFGLLGPNGAGKTTLISIIAGLVRATAGTTKVMGADVITDYRRARRDRGHVRGLQIFPGDAGLSGGHEDGPMPLDAWLNLLLTE